MRRPTQFVIHSFIILYLVLFCYHFARKLCDAQLSFAAAEYLCKWFAKIWQPECELTFQVIAHKYQNRVSRRRHSPETRCFAELLQRIPRMQKHNIFHLSFICPTQFFFPFCTHQQSQLQNFTDGLQVCLCLCHKIGIFRKFAKAKAASNNFRIIVVSCVATTVAFVAVAASLVVHFLSRKLNAGNKLCNADTFHPFALSLCVSF